MELKICSTEKCSNKFIPERNRKYCEDCIVVRKSKSNKQFKISKKGRACTKRYKESITGRATAYRTTKKWRQKYPLKTLAHYIARKHYPEAKPCIIDMCHRIGIRHHEDYNKPLEIVWICRQHHNDYHASGLPLSKFLITNAYNAFRTTIDYLLAKIMA
jgi:hypothetical protein